MSLFTAGCEQQLTNTPVENPNVGTVPTVTPTAGLQENAAKTPEKPAAIAGPEIFLMQIRMVVIRIPAGQKRKIEKLWSYLDEEPLSLKSTVMGLNGFRVGVGKGSDWEDVDRILKNLAGENYELMTVQAPPGVPQPVELKLYQPAQNIFVYAKDQSLEGKLYPPGDNIITISASLDRQNNKRIILTVLPQLRTAQRFTTFSKDGGIMKMEQKPQFMPFRDLEFQLNVPSDDFIIIGPGSQADRKTSVANYFLKETVDGVVFDKLLLFAPKVYKVKLTP